MRKRGKRKEKRCNWGAVAWREDLSVESDEAEPAKRSENLELAAAGASSLAAEPARNTKNKQKYEKNRGSGKSKRCERERETRRKKWQQSNPFQKHRILAWRERQ